MAGNLEYSNCSDEELVALIQQGDEVAFNHLYQKYLPKIRSMVYPFQGLGYDIEDLVQEATIGFFSAIDVYNASTAAFSTFCYICMRRMLISLLRSNTKKGAADYAMIYEVNDFAQHSANPEQQYIAKEEFFALKNKLNARLSPLEKSVLAYYISGMDYSAIAKRLNKTTKSVDNALQRIRTKLRDCRRS